MYYTTSIHIVFLPLLAYIYLVKVISKGRRKEDDEEEGGGGEEEEEEEEEEEKQKKSFRVTHIDSYHSYVYR